MFWMNLVNQDSPWHTVLTCKTKAGATTAGNGPSLLVLLKPLSLTTLLMLMILIVAKFTCSYSFIVFFKKNSFDIKFWLICECKGMTTTAPSACFRGGMNGFTWHVRWKSCHCPLCALCSALLPSNCTNCGSFSWEALPIGRLFDTEVVQYQAVHERLHPPTSISNIE